LFLGHLIQDPTIFVQDGQGNRKEEAPFLPSLQNLKRRTLPKDSGNNDISIEDRLERHFERRLTLAIANFKSAFLISAFFGLRTSLTQKSLEFLKLTVRAISWNRSVW
jgi:hypothetical protein